MSTRSETLSRERQAALRHLGLLDPEPEPAFDRLAALAADLFDAPIALVSLIDGGRAWFKATIGFELASASWELAFWRTATEGQRDAATFVEDLAATSEFAHHPLVTGAPHARFYAGALISDRQGAMLGTLCVIDTKPRRAPSERKLAQLKALAAIAADEIERRVAERVLGRKEHLLSLAERMSGLGHWRFDVATRRVEWSDELYRMAGADPARFKPTIETWAAFIHEDDRGRIGELLGRAAREGKAFEAEFRIWRADGELRELLGRATPELGDNGEVISVFGVLQDVTEQNRALRVATKNKARYKLLADNMADVVTRIRLDGSSNYISPAIADLLGYEPVDMARRQAQDFVYEPDRQLVLQTFAELSGGLEEKTLQHRAAHRDGHPVWVETRFRLLRDASGAPSEMVAVIRDITERRALEAQTLAARDEAREQARRALMAERLAGMGHWRMDVATKSVSWSQTMYGLWGLAFGSTLDFDHLLSMVAPEDRATALDHFDSALRGESSEEQILLRICRADGQLRYLRGRFDAERGSDGAVVAVIGALMDVTEHRLIRLALEESESRYRLLAESAHDIIMHSDLAGRLTYVSPSMEARTGYTSAELLGREVADLAPDGDAEGLRQAMTTQVLRGRSEPPAPVEYRIRCKDGRTIWFESRPTAAFDERTGAVCGVTDILRDVTERRALEAELRAAREAAEAAAAVKSEFLANMSHEIRTPLNSIIGFTDLARAQAGMPELARTYVEQVEKASQALLATVNDILDFSKLEAGQVRIQPEPTEVVRLCRSGLELFTPQAAAKDLQLRLVLDADADLVALLDGNRLRQVLLNLLSNAVKFTASGSVTLEVAYDAAEERLNLAVRDSGQGIPADKLGALFRRFSQVDGGLSRKHGGTGLGLAICKGLVEAMGGRIGADSCEGEGSRFWVSLPAPPCEKRLEDTTSDAEASLVFAGVSVLVVDDHPANRELARLFLTGAGAEVGEACDGAAAVELAGERPFDAILMDVRMPKLDGRQALQKIRAGAGPNAGTPIIAYTADASDQEAERLTALGFDGVVAKPVTAGRLIVGVAEALSVAQSAAAA